MINIVKQYSKQLVNFILPPRCMLSGEYVDENGMIHSSKWKEINFISSPYCNKCGVPFSFDSDEEFCVKCLTTPPIYNKARSAIYYDDGSRDLILKFKHADKTSLSVSLTPLLLKAGKDLFDIADYIIPVPLHRWRLLKRRYNQSAILAKSLSLETGIKYLPDSLIRHRSTKTQGQVSGNGRIKNVKNAFSLNKKTQNVFKNKNIILIDDVFTTGSTVNECSKIIFEAGAENVDILTVSRVV